ncbi:uncharacterized protein YALI1_F14201g [Yarrowia lipolytica]|jgi:hypothetical protein|uniref:Uncharacterized protein n=1 Tax=Yarrowia lipolytica TaxID=4952 RepID=A0A1D8NMY1_YARLL|nr:hypothetical protein YALI1_F14201g [Yarrowia lipolytica]
MGLYDTKPGGRLKLKGDKGKVTKSKKKKISKTSSPAPAPSSSPPTMSLPSAKDIAKSPHDTEHAKESISETPPSVETKGAIPIPGSSSKRMDKAKIAASTSPVETTRTPKEPYLTDAQKKFEEAKKERVSMQVSGQGGCGGRSKVGFHRTLSAFVQAYSSRTAGPHFDLEQITLSF